MKLFALTAVAFMALLGTANAQDTWQPTHNVELVVGNAEGGTVDRLARAIQREIQTQKLMDASVTVVNKPGAGQLIGVGYMNEHEGDAHYVAVLNKTWITSLVSRDTPGYEDVTPIARLFSAYSVYAVQKDSPIVDAQDLARRLHDDPTSVSFAFVARGSGDHMSAIRFAQIAGADPSQLTIALFESASQAALAVAGGHADVMIGSMGTALPLVEGGQLRILGVAGPESGTGDVPAPSFRSQGIDLISQQAYYVIGPRGLSDAQIAFWEDTLEKAIAAPAIQEQAASDSLTQSFARHEETAAWIAQEYSDLKEQQAAAGLSE